MDDLYGDLDTSTQALAKTELQQEKQRVEKENDKLKTELAELQLQNRLLGERTKALETNISTLFVTAQHELKRKDAEIQRLREALTKAERRDSARSDHQSHRRYHESRGDSPSRRSGHSHR
ncbi:hypothetical protein Poli38472_005747 [Pythium oligandrum]|uniref:Uncharacterized protein n=1 Tax=Pythium oligandrum TaxID=41045 RepID=A0A8K1FPE0_PYTOL|nr:hypothetical protein Poli38472_005747 [Pythium oligandrum]|eukprot:TMW68279.1 hypothetical protein Poli38472_005747 [Pythium oligandrum]